jgi:sugar phosphate isomerase/epimerase
MSSHLTQLCGLSRRSFIKLGVGAASAAIPMSMKVGAVSAIGPIDRGMSAHFRFSLAAYSYRDLRTGNNPSLTLHDFVSDCAKFGLEATELTSYYFPKGVTTDYLRDLKRCCFRLGLDISGTAVGNDFGHREGPARAKQIGLVKRWIEFAEILGAPVIRSLRETYARKRPRRKAKS